MSDSTQHNGIICFLYEGGAGAEANVKVELRTLFPGIGGTIITQEGALTAFRQEYSGSQLSGHDMFLRHTLIKKLDDFFYRTHAYQYAHVPRPLGSESVIGDNAHEAYLYEWARGREGFPWVWKGYDLDDHPVSLSEWNTFATSFHDAGVNMIHDVTDSDNGEQSKNIIHEWPEMLPGTYDMNLLWKRIDFGGRSTPIDYDKLSRFLKDREDQLKDVLRPERYDLLVLAVQYLTLGPDKMREYDIGRLDEKVGEYRRSTLFHHLSRGSGVINALPSFGRRTESLLETKLV